MKINIKLLVILCSVKVIFGNLHGYFWCYYNRTSTNRSSTTLSNFDIDIFSAIIGGKDAEVRRYRYMVSLRLFVRYPFCSGSIIDKYHVLTAGHCLDGYSTFIFFLSWLETGNFCIVCVHVNVVYIWYNWPLNSGDFWLFSPFFTWKAITFKHLERKFLISRLKC